jgi:hypothetical protein
MAYFIEGKTQTLDIIITKTQKLGTIDSFQVSMPRILDFFIKKSVRKEIASPENQTSRIQSLSLNFGFSALEYVPISYDKYRGTYRSM